MERVKPKEQTAIESEAILSSFATLSYDDQVSVVSSLLSEISRQEGKNPLELSDEYPIPFGIFSQKKLSSLEAIVKYLKEIKGLRLSVIAQILGRDSSTIWATYANSMRKMPEPFSSIRDEVMMPSSLIADRTLSVLEHVCLFAKKLGYSNHEIATMLLLDDRTIWSVLHRAKAKRGMQ